MSGLLHALRYGLPSPAEFSSCNEEHGPALAGNGGSAVRNCGHASRPYTGTSRGEGGSNGSSAIRVRNTT
jgi:hypothetical protein